jgi:hypothetical protein
MENLNATALPIEFQRFRELATRLISVPKKEINGKLKPRTRKRRNHKTQKK